MFRATHALVSLLACSAIGVLSAACEDDEKATPQVIFEGSIQKGSGDCRDSGELFLVGDFGNPAAKVASTPIPTGQSFGQGVVDISCSVVPSGTDEFQVDATVNLSGAKGGLFKLEGKFKTTGDQTNLRVIASSKQSANSYDERDRGCVARYTVGSNMGVAAGRVWAEIDCPNAVNTSDDNRACRLTGQFRFENCGQ